MNVLVIMSRLSMNMSANLQKKEKYHGTEHMRHVDRRPLTVAYFCGAIRAYFSAVVSILNLSCFYGGILFLFGCC